MLRAAIEKIEDMSRPFIETINGQTYSSKPLNRIDCELRAHFLLTHTLTSIIDYIANGTDDNSEGTDINRRFVLHIENHECVKLMRELDKDRKREMLLVAEGATEQFPFGQHLDVESFIIAMQAYFIQDDTTAKLARLVSNITDRNSITQMDNGLSQIVTAKTGIVTSSEVVVPNPVTLRPRCTFSEVKQPARQFIFRLRGGDGGVKAALFCADGNAWKLQAIDNIRCFLQSSLPDEFRDDVIILA